METRRSCIVIVAAEEKTTLVDLDIDRETGLYILKWNTKGIGYEGVDRIHWACDH